MGVLIELILKHPVIREFITDLVVRVFSELFFKTQSDEKFKKSFLELSQNLEQAKSVEEKRDALRKIHSLYRAS